MYRSFLTASLLSFPTVFAAGTAHVVNNCGFDVYYASVAQNVHANLQKLPSGGYSEAYSKPNVGISIKLATSPSGPVDQFEFTWGSPNIYFDISHIDGNPFAQFGTSLTPSLAGASGYPTCRVLSCPAGQTFCNDAYNLPDDVRTMVCPDSSDLTFTLCPGGAAVNSPPAGSASVVPSSVPVSTRPSFSTSAASSPVDSTTRSFSRPAETTASRPAVTTTADSFRPTSFRTFTTQPAVVPTPAPNSPSSQVFEPIASSAFQSIPVKAPVTTTEQAAQPTEPANPTGQWSWGNWRHYHTHRAHASGFRF